MITDSLFLFFAVMVTLWHPAKDSLHLFLVIRFDGDGFRQKLAKVDDDESDVTNDGSKIGKARKRS